MGANRLLVDLNERAAEVLTVEVCDREVARFWRALKTDPKADQGACREQIDRWLEARHQLVAKRSRPSGRSTPSGGRHAHDAEAAGSAAP